MKFCELCENIHSQIFHSPRLPLRRSCGCVVARIVGGLKINFKINFIYFKKIQEVPVPAVQLKNEDFDLQLTWSNRYVLRLLMYEY